MVSPDPKIHVFPCFEDLPKLTPKNDPDVGKCSIHGTCFGHESWVLWMTILIFPKRNCHTQQLQDVRVLLDGVALLTAGRCGCGTEQESRDGEDGDRFIQAQIIKLGT